MCEFPQHNTPLDHIVSLATKAVRAMGPTPDTAANLSEIASACCRLGLLGQSAALLELALDSVEPGNHPALRPTALLAIASASCDCGNKERALKLCDQVRKLLIKWQDPTAEETQTMLALLLGRLGLVSESTAIAANILERKNDLPELLSTLAVGRALRIYLAIGELRHAEQILREAPLASSEHALFLAALNLLPQRDADDSLRRRADWVKDRAAQFPPVLAVLMVWYARAKATAEVRALWAQLTPKLGQANDKVREIATAAMASLALRSTGEVAEGRRLADRARLWWMQGPIVRIGSFERRWLARALTAYGDLETAKSLDIDDEDQGYVAEGIVSQLVEDTQAAAALSVIGSSSSRLRPGLLFRLALELLKNRQLLEGFDDPEFLEHASRLLNN